MRESRERFLFGPFCLDAATGALTKDGMPVPLGAMATELLLYLVRHSERLTTYEELEQALWPDSAPEVSPKNTLSRHISEVRTALGDNARRSRYVRTVQGKGYRFIQPVRRDEAAASGVTPQGQEDAVHAGIQGILASIGVDVPDRIRRLLREAIGIVVFQGAAAAELKDKLTEAMALCGDADRPRFFIALQGLCLYCIMRAELRAAREIGETLSELAQALPSAIYEKYANGTRGVLLCFLGEYPEALGLLERGPGLDDHDPLIPMVGFTDLRASRFCYMAHVSYALGYPDRARGWIDEAFRLANIELFDSRSVVFCCQFGAWLYQLLRMPKTAYEWATRTVQFSAGLSYQPWQASGRIVQGWSLAKQGGADSGIALMRQGIRDWEAAAARVALPRCYTLLAEAYGDAGRIEEGLRALDTALAVMEDTGDRHYAAETHRMRGVLLLRQGTQAATEKAETAFREALRIARQQQAKSFALRVAISWGEHLVDTNRPDEARRLLGRIYDGFTEGAGTLDHQEAQALLQRVR